MHSSNDTSNESEESDSGTQQCRRQANKKSNDCDTQNEEIACGGCTSNVVIATIEWQWSAFENYYNINLFLVTLSEIKQSHTRNKFSTIMKYKIIKSKIYIFFSTLNK